MLVLFVFAGCSYLERLKIPFTRGVDPQVRHKEVVRIDNQYYVKVLNPEAGTGEARSQYLYVPVQEYLANREAYDAVVPSMQPPEEEEWEPVELGTVLPLGPQESDSTDQMKDSLHFKKRLMVAPFRDLAGSSQDGLSGIFMRRLESKIETTSDQIILFDADIMVQRLGKKKLDTESFDSPEIARLASQLYNIHAIMIGTIDHVFVSSTESPVMGRSKTAYAIAEMSARLIDTTSGTVLRLWEKRNPIFDSQGKGEFSDEKARLKAFDLIASELAMDVIEELNGIDWYTTIADVDGDRVYISAGKLSGVRVGDIFSVYSATIPSDPKGEIRVATLFGLDASVADITKGKGFRANDLVRPGFQ